MKPLNGTLILLATAYAAALAGCTTTATLDSQSDTALRQMSDALAAADQLSFSASRKMDRQLIENPNVIGHANIEAQVDRPDRAKAVVKGGGKERHLYLGSGSSAIYTPDSGFYARFPGHPTIEKSCDAAAANLGLHIPIQDFLSANPYRDFTAGSDTIVHAGVDQVGGMACDHLKGSREDLSWDLWIARSDHLPRRYRITVAELDGKDHLQLDFMNWNLSPSFPAGTFDFTPPKSAREIDFLVVE
jgi:hypothetical protein